MALLRTYPSVVQAGEVVSFLLQNGVPAARVSDVFSVFGHAAPRHHVVVDEADIEAAETVLAEMDDLPEVSPAELEMLAAPDLRLLSPDLAPLCPRCSLVLPLTSLQCACPGCSEACDIVELLITKHGPEVLADCYASAEDTENDMTESTVACPQCRYRLTGLPTRSTCPECGLEYDKLELLHRQAGL